MASIKLTFFRTALVVFLSDEMRSKAPGPTLDHENRLWAAGHRFLAGLDEAGRGAWAGPVVAAAVILPHDDPELLKHLAGVRDSKQLSATRRESLLETIQDQALAWGAGSATPAEIDELGIVPATRHAMGRALEILAHRVDYLLLDYIALPEVALPQFSLPKGDALVLSIAAASIVAKVSRDRMMVELGEQLPGFGFARHKGYGTPQHRAALHCHGPTQAHRFSFAPVRLMMSSAHKEEE